MYVVIRELMFEQKRLKRGGWRRDMPGEGKKANSLGSLGPGKSGWLRRRKEGGGGLRDGKV